MIVYLDDKRRPLVDLAAKLQHAVAGVPLLFIGVEKLVEGVELPVALVETGIALAVLLTFALEGRAVKQHHNNPGGEHAHPRVGWFDLAAGVLLIFEAFHSPHHKPGYLRPQFLAGIVTLSLGIFHGPLQHAKQHRRRLEIDDSGVKLRMAPFRRWSVKWEDLVSVDVTAGHAVFELTNGRKHSINLKRFHNAEAVRQAISAHTRVTGLLRG